MINRILIRIKVIQILYSFLLVEKHFSIEGSPTAPTKEKRFAYALYLDLLVLMIRLGERLSRFNSEYILAGSGFISRLKLDETVRTLTSKYLSEPFPFESVENDLAKAVKDSAIYKNYIKDSGKGTITSDEYIWRDLFNIIIMNYPPLMEIISQKKDYSLKAVERAEDMINRTFVNFLASQDNIKDVEKSLKASLDKARELYMRLLYLPVELTDLEDRILDDNRHKFLKNEKDINPDLRFVENKMADALRKNPVLEKYIKDNKLSWLDDDPLLMRRLLQSIKDSEYYKSYMSSPDNDIHSDASLWRDLLKNVILVNSDFLESLEEKSVFWNDDLEIMSTFVLKSFRKIEEGDENSAVLNKFKDEEDEVFGMELIKYVYRDRDIIRVYVEDALRVGNWERERLAFMDFVIIVTAIAEILNFPKIPVKVSINEYIELAKSYSSSNSGHFVNGIIGSIVSRLQREGKLLKK